MAKIKKTIEIETEVGMEIKTTRGIYRDDIRIFICYVDGNIIYYSDDKNAPIKECESIHSEDCYLI